ADRNRSHWSTSKTPSYTKSVSWQHHQVLYRYALAIARAAEGDKMPIKKPEFDEGRTQASVKFYSNTPRRVG
ncbi:hypothetical protein, partial [Escherichia coli]|uniref:hypothetical protein n=1 Tax=Escherichia coli TaxID=562 RepID=UPI00234CDF64